MTKSTNYRAYLLRLWREHRQAPWRASLEEAQSREKHNFADIASLMAFIEKHTERSSDVSSTSPSEGGYSVESDGD